MICKSEAPHIEIGEADIDLFDVDHALDLGEADIDLCLGAIELDLAPEQQRRIDAMFARLEGAQPHELLGVRAGADLMTIKRAYDKRAIAFHPDRFFRKRLGSYAKKLEAIFIRMTAAHDALCAEQKEWVRPSGVRHKAAGMTTEAVETLRALLDARPGGLDARDATRFESLRELFARAFVTDGEAPFFPRLRVPAAASVTLSHDADVLEATTLEIASDGFLVLAPAPIALGAKCAVLLEVDEMALGARARVASCDHEGRRVWLAFDPPLAGLAAERLEDAVLRIALD
ncbi:MAG TPA: J domain-containing protein [Labilithrix sp.]|jgi:hypothetical protein